MSAAGNRPVLDLVAATVTLPDGQARLALPFVPRVPYPTGQQEPCAACAKAGVDRLGVSREGRGSRGPGRRARLG